MNYGILKEREQQTLKTIFTMLGRKLFGGNSRILIKTGKRFISIDNAEPIHFVPNVSRVFLHHLKNDLITGEQITSKTYHMTTTKDFSRLGGEKYMNQRTYKNHHM